MTGIMENQTEDVGALQKRVAELAGENSDLTVALQEKHADDRRQMRAWALDRAIETGKRIDNIDSTGTLDIAEEYVAWVMEDK